ncbi:MAG: nucleotidyltransferase domain-containing protein [Myxococcota bacterium]|nr:nucleotidyltransferase domain-containing protein [Myxococcota bacterium]
MPGPDIVAIVKAYLRLLGQAGVPARRAVIFGSHARGTARPDSDIDVLVVSPVFDVDRFGAESVLWRLTRKVDSRIEPVPVGEAEYAGEARSPLVYEARRTGFVVEAP